jgi:hypothetical protein
VGMKNSGSKPNVEKSGNAQTDMAGICIEWFTRAANEEMEAKANNREGHLS